METVHTIRDLVLNKQVQDEIEIKRAEFHKEQIDSGCEGNSVLKICDLISEYCSSKYNWYYIAGYYHGIGNKEPRGTYHCWCVDTSGNIIDCSADQFGLPPILMIPPNHEWRKWYKEEFAEIKNRLEEIHKTTLDFVEDWRKENPTKVRGEHFEKYKEAENRKKTGAL